MLVYDFFQEENIYIYISLNKNINNKKILHLNENLFVIYFLQILLVIALFKVNKEEWISEIINEKIRLFEIEFEIVSNCQVKRSSMNYILSSLFNEGANFKSAILDVRKLRWSIVKFLSAREYCVFVWHEEGKEYLFALSFKNFKTSDIENAFIKYLRIVFITWTNHFIPIFSN